MLDYALQCAAVVTLIVGLWLGGNKDRRGPALASFSELLWIIIGVTHEVWGLALLSVVLAVVQFRAFLKWSK